MGHLQRSAATGHLLKVPTSGHLADQCEDCCGKTSVFRTNLVITDCTDVICVRDYSIFDLTYEKETSDFQRWWTHWIEAEEDRALKMILSCARSATRWGFWLQVWQLFDGEWFLMRTGCWKGDGPRTWNFDCEGTNVFTRTLYCPEAPLNILISRV